MLQDIFALLFHQSEEKGLLLQVFFSIYQDERQVQLLMHLLVHQFVAECMTEEVLLQL
jgi:hypothetical protein